MQLLQEVAKNLTNPRPEANLVPNNSSYGSSPGGSIVVTFLPEEMTKEKDNQRY